MKERPILFSGPMVRAILAGRKTQTRRVVTPAFDPPEASWCEGKEPSAPFIGADGVWRWMRGAVSFTHDDRRCPFGAPGDRLWVRETWMPFTEDGVPNGAHIFAATDKPEPDGDRPLKWRPSIFMPREACRIQLEVEAVRVERLQDITTADIEAEGVIESRGPRGEHLRDGTIYETPRLLWADGWDRLNGKRGYGWDVNPWVWVVSFKRVEARA